ncbi:MAG: hypothetical protein QOJ40_1995 [Verrucomicrobiota bacterium]
MNKLIYVETTIPSFYTETRDDEEIRIRRKWTREWWHMTNVARNLTTSFVVQDELKRIPDTKRRDAALQLIEPLEQFVYTTEIEEIVEVYLAHKLIAKAWATPRTWLSLPSTIVIFW